MERALEIRCQFVLKSGIGSSFRAEIRYRFVFSGKNDELTPDFRRARMDDTGFPTPDFRHRISDTGFPTPDFRHRISDTGFPTPDFRHRFPPVPSREGAPGGLDRASGFPFPL